MTERPFYVTKMAEAVEVVRTWKLRAERPLTWTVNASRKETDTIVPLSVVSRFRDGVLTSVTVTGLEADYATSAERVYFNEDHAPAWLWSFCALDRNPMAGQE
ncbi:hypothetical protein [Micromonospora avicenniae]|uniref:hypothetical protein n=1 Tax=Micromonospora avicenniae TaxID=1198245 RepID=UPI003321B9C2